MRSAADRAAARGLGAPSFLFVPALRTLGARFTLEGEEARYVTRVVRVREAERVTASDGAGLVATLRVERVKPDLVLALESSAEVPRPVPARVLCGAPEGERGDWLVEKLAELGITDLQPVDTERAHWPAGRGDRWERLTVAAMRQSRAAWRMAVHPAVGLTDAMAAAREGTRWLADPAGEPASGLLPAADGAAVAAVGPASGFTEPERKALRGCGFTPVSLADRRLRTETAAVATAALWAAARSPAGQDAAGRGA
jgi:16S rRNA (uracil1498-N3)-methyltransferase